MVRCVAGVDGLVEWFGETRDNLVRLAIGVWGCDKLYSTGTRFLFIFCILRAFVVDVLLLRILDTDIMYSGSKDSDIAN